jgi:hypothetical protein
MGAALALAIAASASGQQASFVAASAMPGWFPAIPIISGDGTTVFGYASSPNGPFIYRWVPGGGVEVLPNPPPPPNIVPLPTACSQNGGIMLGSYTPYSTCRWTAATGAQWLPIHHTLACSADGSILSGTDLLSDMYLWSGGVRIATVPPPLPLSGNLYEITALSADASVAVGNYDQGGWRAFRWSATTGTVPFHPHLGRAYAISSDGNVVVGYRAGGFTANRWTPRGSTEMGLIDTAYDVSADGWVAIGETPTGQAYLWDPVHGSRNLQQVLLGHGLNVSGWGLVARHISDDGRRIVGTGTPPGGGDPTVWMATIPAFCYANCDGSGTAPALNVGDFTCFLQKFAAGDVYANCDNDAFLNVADFTCFLQRFAAGCP